MIKRITVRIDEELERLISALKEFKLLNFSALVREALKKYLLNCIDNSENHTPIEKGLHHEI